MFVKRLKPVSILTVLALALMPIHGYCLPTGEQVVEGSATFDRPTADTLNVNQATDKMVANYNSFSIAAPEAVHFIQPSSSSVALNRVVGVDPSLILGTLTANGKIFLINPNGVMFGQGCKVDTMGLVASTLNMSNADFMAGRYTFVGDGGSVVNLGYLSAPGGYVALLGSRVENKGIIEAELGSVALASGKAVTLKLDPKGLISVVIDEATISNAGNKDEAVKNSGTIKANGGKVLLTAKTLDGVFKNAVNTSGLIEANSIGDVTGEVAVEANQRVVFGGTINAKGGIVRANCQGADFDGAINAKLGIYNMNNGDTNINGNLVGGEFTGDVYVYDNLNINVSGYTEVTSGSLYITADADHNHTGDLSVNGASLIVNEGDISLSGVNISVEDSVIAATRHFSPVFDTVSVNIQAENNISISSTGAEGTDFSQVFSIMKGFGNAQVNLKAGTGPGEGVSTLSINESDVIAQVMGEGEAYVGIVNNKGPVTIQGATILTHILSGADTAKINIDAFGDLTMSDTAVTALIETSGPAKIYLHADGNINVDDASEITASSPDLSSVFCSAGKDIVSLGLVNAQYLGMLAQGNIGSSGAPIRTDVDSVSANSWGQGDIFINQGNPSRLLELGAFFRTLADDEEWLYYGASVSANDGIVHITTAGDMRVNSVNAFNGGVFLESLAGKIYAGQGWEPALVDETAAFVMEIIFKNQASQIPGEVDDPDLSPFMTPVYLDSAVNVWATGYSYFSTPNGTIGVELKDDPDLQGSIAGIVRPGVSDELSPRPGFDLVPESGYVIYDEDGAIQIWPDDPSYDVTSSVNPLVVNIQLVEGAKSAAPVRGDEYDQPFSPVAGLTLNYAVPTLKPVEPDLDASAQLAGALVRNLRAYYEILNTHRFVSNEPATPSTFFGYRPLTPTNMAAFDEMNLDIGAYDFISDNIKTKKPLSPYYGL
jgi:filamentous hemagglutinin family protein